MAINDDAVFTASRGYIFTAPINTVAPAVTAIDTFDPDTGISGWDSVGHTSIDDLPEFGFDGGDSEVRGTWQNSALREVVTKAVSDFVTFELHQFDENALTLYYGETSPGTVEGVFSVNSGTNAPVERALLMVVVDGGTAIGFHAGRASFKRDDSVSLSTDSFAFLPVRATFLKGTGPLFSWISSDTGVNHT
jgi:hypothetical protein